MDHTGREYFGLSEPHHRVVAELDQRVLLSDGTVLLADVFRPEAVGPFPALLAASPFPRQIQGWRAPVGFVQSGDTNFFVSRGFVHVVANLRGTGGSGGRLGLGDAIERQDVAELLAWVAGQGWSNGRIGMVGAGYFGNVGVAAALTRAPRLAAVFVAAPIPRRWEPTSVEAFVRSVAAVNGPPDPVWRHKLLGAARHLSVLPALHSRWEHQTGVSAVDALAPLLNGQPQATGQVLWPPAALLPADLATYGLPVYLGHDPLDGAAQEWPALAQDPSSRLAVTAPGSIGWPWSSLHVEALAWFDHWLRDRDTGVMSGPRIRRWEAGRWAAAER